MIGLVLLTYDDIGVKMIEASTHMLGYRPEKLEALSAIYDETPESLAPRIRSAISGMGGCEGILLLTDLYGTTHCNVASGFIDDDRIVMVSGLNMASLIRAITYRKEKMDVLLKKVIDGGREGISMCKKLDNYSKLIP